MQPLSPTERDQLLTVPGVTDAEIDEYETLLSRRFSDDPDQPPTVASQDRAKRLEELHAKLYPKRNVAAPADADGDSNQTA